VHPHLPKLKALLSGLSERIALRPKVVVIRHLLTPTDETQWDESWVDWKRFVAGGKVQKLGRTTAGEIEWKRLDFNWPLWILFSSGTTGERALNLSCALNGPSRFHHRPPGWWYVAADEEGIRHLRRPTARGRVLLLHDNGMDDVELAH